MSYGLVYLAIGCLMALFILIYQGKKSEIAAWLDALRNINWSGEKRAILHTLFASSTKLILAVFGMIFFWPQAGYMAYNDWRISRQQSEPSLEELLNYDPDPELVVSHSDLVEQLSQAEIEARELIDDPLDAVPNLPFGHLHCNWVEFIANIDPQSTLWSYEVRRTTIMNERQLFRGYVAVCSDGTISKPFRTYERDELDGAGKQDCPTSQTHISGQPIGKHDGG